MDFRARWLLTGVLNCIMTNLFRQTILFMEDFFSHLSLNKHPENYQNMNVSSVFYAGKIFLI